ncbi:type III effector HrpK domain-containing protein [Pseudomonas sp. SZMC_28357]|uniref:type III effector HrpK domain-containing protein n=1 Tax=Pseudomonas sp. SZMC_28357 TaxID=3074380 RepID=UPI0028718003|nr:type III effector HrpK domain-containing protein [Pseudomonas sp. SZMC_28357]MDR9750833.1 type III effector HrpK domain-containing protein [Pseudomonas sp. SZMC_28357]
MTTPPLKVQPAANPNPNHLRGVFETAMARALTSLQQPAADDTFKKPLVLTTQTVKTYPAPTDKAAIRAEVEATGDKEALKRLDDPNLAGLGNTGVPLANIASINKLSENVLELKTRDHHTIIIVKQATPYLFDGMAGKTDAVNTINKSMAEGYTLAQAGDVAPGMGDYKFLGNADEVGPGMIRYETFSGNKIIVSKEVNMGLYEQVKSDSEALKIINDNQKDGYRLAQPGEAASSTGVTGKADELGHDLIRYQTTSGDKVIVSKNITPDLYDQKVKESNALFGVSGAVDTALIDNSKYGAGAKDWDKIVGNGSGTPTQEAKDLDRPRAAAKLLEENWDNWNLHGEKIDFSNPPSTLPPEAQATLKYVASSPNLMAALDSGGYGKTDGVITRNDVKNFAKQADKDLSAASGAYDKFIKAHPDATPLAKENAKSAALVMANISLVSSAGPEMQGDNRRTSVGNLNTSNMDAIEGDAALSKSLTGAAGYWSSPGMFRLLDNGGDHPATMKTDGIAQQHNFATWLERQAPTDDHGVLMMLSNASARNSVADVDTSKLTKDVFEHPEKYDGKTKAAVLTEITDARVRMELSANPKDDSDLFSQGQSDMRGINPNKAKITAQLDATIAKLSADPDVQNFFAQNQGTGMRDIINADPAMKIELQHFQDREINSGNVLNKSLERKDADGKTLSLTDGMYLAATDASITDMALGGNGEVDLSVIAKNSGKSEQIEQYFRENIVTGKALDEALAKDRETNGDKADPAAVIAKFSNDATLYKAYLGDKVSPEDADVTQQIISQKISETLVDGANDDVMKQIFGDANGNFDEAKTKAIIDKAMADDPAMFTDAAGKPIAAGDVVTMIRSSWDLERQGQKMSDVLPKAIDGFKADASETYKQGLLHVGSALLAGAVLTVRSTSGGNTPTDNALRVSAGMQFAGLLMEGGTKYAKEAGYGKEWKPVPNSNVSLRAGQGPFTADQIKAMGNIGKIIGGAGSFIGGVFGIVSGVNAAFSGDKLNAGFSLTSGILGTGAAVASIIEGAAGLFGSSTAGLVGTLAGTTAGILGWAAAGVGILAGIIVPVIFVAKREAEQNKFYEGLVPTLQKYELTGGPKEDGDIDDIIPTSAT